MLATKGYGFTVDDIDWSCPADLEPYGKAYELETKQIDYLSWIAGQYTLSAVSVAVEHCLAGNKARLQYIEMPIMQQMEEEEYESRNERKEYKGLTDEEKEERELEKAKNFFNSLLGKKS